MPSQGRTLVSVFLDLTARCLQYCLALSGLHLRLPRTIPDEHTVSFTMEMLSNSNGQSSKVRKLKS